jgi:hypothetical protein
MLSALCWVRGSSAKSVPVKYEPPLEDNEEQEEDEDEEKMEETVKDQNNLEAIYNLENYDEEGNCL